MQLVCKKCGYSVEKDKIPEKCPYCNREGTITEKKSAQDLLNEVSENPGLYS